MVRYLGTDAETGGIGLDKSLLTAYFVVMDSKFNPIDDLYLYVRPDDEVYRVTAEALRINGIDLKEHDKVAESREECMRKLVEFCKMHSEDGKMRLIPTGHGVAFDINFYKHALLRKPTQIDKYLDYRCLDTCSIARFLQITGKLPPKMRISLDELARFFKIPKPEIHDAKGDTLVCIQVLQEFIKLVTPALKPEELAYILGMDPNVK